MNQKIEKALVSKDADFFRSITEADIKNYRNKKSDIGILLDACINSSPEVIEIIVERMMKYFDSTYSVEGLDKDKEEEISELKQDEIFDFFYEAIGTEEFGTDDNAAMIALKRGDTKTLKLLQEKVNLTPEDYDSIHIKYRRLERAGDLTTPHSKTTWGGFFPKEFEIKKSKPHSFENQRERQLLKQLSTVLFFHMKQNERVQDLVEIQAMHLSIDEKDYLFIAGNKAISTSRFKNVFPNCDEIKNKLKQSPKISGDKEGRVRVKRYTKNFEKRIFGKDIYEVGEKKDFSRYKDVRKLIRNMEEMEVLKLKYNASYKLDETSKQKIRTVFKENSGQIIFLDTSSCKKAYKSRHSEEFLSDIAEIAIAQYDKDDVYTCIGGKKRPCMTCYGTMAAKKINNYGKHPGFLWMDSLGLQNPASAQKTLEALSTTCSYITSGKDGSENHKDYDSGTDESLPAEKFRV